MEEFRWKNLKTIYDFYDVLFANYLFKDHQ